MIKKGSAVLGMVLPHFGGVFTHFGTNIHDRFADGFYRPSRNAVNCLDHLIRGGAK